MAALPSTIYQCKECKKVIGKLNPKVREPSYVKLNLVRADTGGPLRQPQGWCQFCKAEYVITLKDLIHTNKLKDKEKKALGKEIQVEIETAKIAAVPEMPEEIEPEPEDEEDTGPVLSKKDAFLKKKKGK